MLATRIRMAECRFAIIRSLMYLDGMVLRCEPDAVLLRGMRRFIGEFQKMV